MHIKSNDFNVLHTLEELKHYLPAQAPLKDFIHHNTLHAFQKSPFFEGINEAHEIFGYQVFLSIEAYRTLFKEGKIDEAVVDRILAEKEIPNQIWKDKLIKQLYLEEEIPELAC